MFAVRSSGQVVLGTHSVNTQLAAFIVTFCACPRSLPGPLVRSRGQEHAMEQLGLRGALPEASLVN